jgi:hypothetical protein
MPSPFPGMNPFLEEEDVWHDFHESYLPALRDHLAAQLPAHYIAKINEHLYIHEPTEERRLFFGRADVFVATQQSAAASGATATLGGPAQVLLPAVDVEGLSLLEIHDRRDRRLVTVIELLSWANKYAGADREQYLVKRGQLLRSRTHFVEIDLLRGGPRMPFAGALPECDYYAMVSRVEKRPQADLWPIRLRERLPVLPIPLRAPDADAHLDLKAVLDQVYDGARYGNYIYESQPQPNLRAEDSAWAAQFLPAR